MDLKALAHERQSEKFSKGENIKKLLELHILPYMNQEDKNILLENLKNIDKTEDVFLDWFGVLKGVKRPHTTINNEELNQFFNVINQDKVGFSSKDLSKPLYFGQKNYFRTGDPVYRNILKAYCKLTNFTGSIEDFEIFFKDVFDLGVIVTNQKTHLELIVEHTNDINLDDIMMFDLTPELPQTQNKFYISPYLQMSLEFENIKGTNLNFEGLPKTSLYFTL